MNQWMAFCFEIYYVVKEETVSVAFIPLRSGRSTCRPSWTSVEWLVKQNVKRSSTLFGTSRAATAVAMELWPGCHEIAPSSPRSPWPLRSTVWTSAWVASPSQHLPASPHCDHTRTKPGGRCRKVPMMFSEPLSGPNKWNDQDVHQ